MTQLLPFFPDVELVLFEMLGDIAPTDVRTPAVIDGPQIRVLRTGGTDDGVTDSPVVAVTTYATTRADSTLLARECARRIEAARATMVGDVLIDYAAVYTGPIETPDQNPDIRVITTYYVIEYRRTRGT